MNEDLIQKHMKLLGCSREDAINLIHDDLEVDRMTMGQINATLTDDQKQAIKDMTKTTSRKKKPTVYNFEKKTKKVDNEKAEIIQQLLESINKISNSVEIINPERELEFLIGDSSYSLTLIKHRKKK